jgi:hypothetical protein
MLGAHLLTAGAHPDATEQFDQAARLADKAAAPPEAILARAFGALSDLAGGDCDAEEPLAAHLAQLRDLEDGEMFVAQVETARRVIEAG